MGIREEGKVIPNEERLYAEKQTIAEVFSPDKFYIIPPFQRRFVWDKENFQQLMEDLWEAFESGKGYYFLGSIVLSREGRNLYKVIDGQQRLTTISLLYATLRDIVNDNELRAELNNFIYSPPARTLNRNEDFRIKFESPDSRPESKEYEAIIRGKAEEIKYPRFREALDVFKKWLEDKSLDVLEKFISFLNLQTYMVVISTREIETAINIFNVINSRGLPLTNADLIKSYIYERLPNEQARREFVKEWERLETEFSEERFGQNEFDAILGFIRSYYNPQKPKEALFKEYTKLIQNNEIKVSEFKDLLSSVTDLYEGLIKDLDKIDNLPIDSSGKTKLKNMIIILREFYPSSEWIGAVVWFYKVKGEERFLEFVKALEKRLYLDWLVGKTPTVRLRPVYETLEYIKNNKSTDEIMDNLAKDLPNKETIESHLDAEDFYGKFRGRLAKYTLLRIEYSAKERDLLDNLENITVEHILPRSPTDEWKKIFGYDYDKYVNKLGNLTLIKGNLNSKMRNKPFNEKKKLLIEAKGREFTLLNNTLLQQYTKWTRSELENRHKNLKELVLSIYTEEHFQ